MANTSASDVITSFQSIIRDRETLAEDLQYQWFIGALGEFHLEVSDLPYDNDLQMFDHALPIYTINTLAYLMKVRYLEREVSRVNKINNIRTRDLTLDGAGDAKRATASEYEAELARTKEFIHKQKTHWFV
ncbi:MAG: hypothetical protein PHX74_06510 [Candidatus Sumerlaeales bacterium]|nr:hypothetical protein [Candidatus Sumerlaeales bacterium]